MQIMRNMVTRTLTLVFLVYLHSIRQGAYSSALRCRRCDKAAYVSDCHDLVQCLDDEVCYMDEIVTEELLIYYNAGCRSKSLCEKSVGQNKRERLYTSCSRCCNDEPFCNDQLCNIQKITDEVLCYQCGYKMKATNEYHSPTRYPGDCEYIGACNPGEVCFLKATTDHEHEGQLLHYSKCMSLTVCHEIMKSLFQQDEATGVVGKREPSSLDHTACTACCGDDLCNVYSCNTIKQRLKYLYQAGFLNATTLKEI